MQVIFLFFTSTFSPKKSMFYAYFSKFSTAVPFVSACGTPGAPAPRFFGEIKNESSREKNKFFLHLQVLFLFFASTIFIFGKYTSLLKVNYLCILFNNFNCCVIFERLGAAGAPATRFGTEKKSERSTEKTNTFFHL